MIFLYKEITFIFFSFPNDESISNILASLFTFNVLVLKPNDGKIRQTIMRPKFQYVFREKSRKKGKNVNRH